MSMRVRSALNKDSSPDHSISVASGNVVQWNKPSTKRRKPKTSGSCLILMIVGISIVSVALYMYSFLIIHSSRSASQPIPPTTKESVGFIKLNKFDQNKKKGSVRKIDKENKNQPTTADEPKQQEDGKEEKLVEAEKEEEEKKVMKKNEDNQNKKKNKQHKKNDKHKEKPKKKKHTDKKKGNAEKEKAKEEKIPEEEEVGDVEITLEVATKACAKARNQQKTFCINDVMATGDLEMAEDPFYN